MKRDNAEFGGEVAQALNTLMNHGGLWSADALRGEIRKAKADAAMFKNDNEALAEALDRLDDDKGRLADKLRQAKANAGEQAEEADRLREAMEEAEKIAEEMRGFADEWRALYYSAAERADNAERAEAEAKRRAEERKGFGEAVAERRAEAAEDKRDHVSALLDKERSRADRAESRAELAEEAYQAEVSARVAAEKRVQRFRRAADYWRNAYGNLAANVVTGKAKAEAVSRPMSEGGQRFAVVYTARDGFAEHRRRINIGPFSCAGSRDAEVERNRRACERVHSVERMS